MTMFEGKRPSLGVCVFIDSGVMVSGEVKIVKDSSVFYNTVIRGDVKSIAIGSETNIQDNCTLHVSGAYNLELGNGVTVGHNAFVH